MRQWAAEKVPRVKIEIETEKFSDYHLARGNRFADWCAAWRTWMRNSLTMGGALYSPDEIARMRLEREATAAGFRKPHEYETFSMYRSAYESWKVRDLPVRNVSSLIGKLAQNKGIK